MMDLQTALNKLAGRQDLTGDEMQAVMRLIMLGEATPAQIGGFLIALRMKGETAEEIAAAARVMREFAAKVDIIGEHQIDIVGTGGDNSHTFNISTTSAFVVAAAGGRVAKHNNRSVSSRSGSADVLELAGVRLGLSPQQVADCVHTIGVGFMFAPAHHSATRHAAGPRRELGVRSIFNLLGPLTNPAQVPNLLIGVYTEALLNPFAEVLKKLGSRHVLVVHSRDGMDEISISAPTSITELRDGKITRYEIAPSDFGLDQAARDSITVTGVDDSFSIMQDVLDNIPGPARDIVALNPGAAIYAADLAGTLQEGVETAMAVLASGDARKKLEELVALTKTLAENPESGAGGDD